MRTSCAGGSSSSTRTGKRCATRTQFTERCTSGSECGVDAVAVEHAGADAHDLAAHGLPSVDHGMTVAQSPMAICARSVSRKLATANHSSDATSVNRDWLGATVSPVSTDSPVT